MQYVATHLEYEDYILSRKGGFQKLWPSFSDIFRMGFGIRKRFLKTLSFLVIFSDSTMVHHHFSPPLSICLDVFQATNGSKSKYMMWKASESHKKIGPTRDGGSRRMNLSWGVCLESSQKQNEDELIWKYLSLRIQDYPEMRMGLDPKKHTLGKGFLFLGYDWCCNITMWYCY